MKILGTEKGRRRPKAGANFSKRGRYRPKAGANFSKRGCNPAIFGLIVVENLKKRV